VTLAIFKTPESACDLKALIAQRSARARARSHDAVLIRRPGSFGHQ